MLQHYTNFFYGCDFQVKGEEESGLGNFCEVNPKVMLMHDEQTIYVVLKNAWSWGDVLGVLGRIYFLQGFH